MWLSNPKFGNKFFLLKITADSWDMHQLSRENTPFNSCNDICNSIITRKKAAHLFQNVVITLYFIIGFLHEEIWINPRFALKSFHPSIKHIIWHNHISSTCSSSVKAAHVIEKIHCDLFCYVNCLILHSPHILNVRHGLNRNSKINCD
mmetsp:Transcript_15818/g.31000  ORF Transcript_15818/g.31000 Transcript_15818/m.31000 type:complete len:148 (+) Transcript_15818:957-1400(+)